MKADMALDEYNVLMQGIYGELAEISKRTQDMAKVGVARSGHAAFDSILARQDQLIQQATRLTNSFLP